MPQNSGQSSWRYRWPNTMTSQSFPSWQSPPTSLLGSLHACSVWSRTRPCCQWIKWGENWCSVSSWKPWKTSKSIGSSVSFFTFMILSRKRCNFRFYFRFGLRLTQKPPISTTTFWFRCLPLINSIRAGRGSRSASTSTTPRVRWDL